MRLSLVRSLAAIAAFALSLPASAAFHLFTINEAYSNASGTIQYLELTALAGGQQFTANHTLVSTSGTTRTFTLQTNLPGDTATRRFLFGTAGVQAAFGVTPDYILPDGFLHTAAGTFNWGEGSDVWSHPALPTGGAINRAGNLVFPSPQNFAGVVGAGGPAPIQLTQVVQGLTQPLDIRFAPGVTNRMFVVEKTGRIRVVNGSTILGTDFLNLSSIISTSGERGLLGLAFHPDYANNRAFYVYYTAAGTGAITIARYFRNANNPDVADTAGSAVVLTFPHADADNHNGGGIQFGKDGLLYIATGDGGGSNDTFMNGQNINTRLGKMLRIAVNPANGTYSIPAGNMYPAGGTCATTGCPETFHIGLRNPWRFSVDKLTGDFYIGDVGQGAVEEVDFRLPTDGPANFGWGVYEGNNCFNNNYFGNGTACQQLNGHTRPILTYGHNAQGGFAITGGYVYRGRNLVGMGGWYVYGDFETGNLWAARREGANWNNVSLAPVTSNQLSAFGQDHDGEIYLAKIDTGRVFRIDAVATAPSPTADGDNDGVPNGVEGQEGLNYNLKDNDIFQVSRLFAMQQYRDFLGREGDAAGIQFYDDLLTGNQADRAALIESFFNSGEFSGTVSPVVRLYFATFLRIPDYPGLTFQVNALRTGTPLPVIAQNFTASPEFQATYGSLNNAQYVTLLYQNILGRTPSQGEVDFHVARLDGGETRGGVLAGFSESPEYQQSSSISVYVTMMYAGMLRRAPEQAGFDFWKDYMTQGNSGLALINGFLNAPEYRSRFLP